MNAAIYARKSTAQDDVAEDAKSVPRQIEGARAFIAARGWTLDEGHIYTDDGVSGALFAKRPDFQRMMRNAAAGVFEAVVFFDLDRFGRHAHHTMVALNKLADVGVQVWDFSTGVRVDLDSFEGRISATLKAEFAQQYRDQVRKHTRSALRRKAEAGLVAGCKVFGYDNIRIAKGHSERRINPTEAAIVRDMYARAAAGAGCRSIAEALNLAGVPKPRAQQGRANGWSASTVRAVLERPLYRGIAIYGRSAKAYDRELKKADPGTKREKGQVPTPEDTWIRIDTPELRIIEADLADRVDARRRDRRTRYQASLVRRGGPMPEQAHGRYLLSGGMLICPNCKGHFEARRAPWKRDSDGVYVCATRRRKPGVCTNTLALPILQTDNDILSVIEGEVLSSTFVAELLSVLDTPVNESDDLSNQRQKLQNEVNNLIESIALGTISNDLAAPAIKVRQAGLAQIEARLQKVRSRRALPSSANPEQLRAALEQRVESWRTDLRGEPKIARLLLRRLIGPVTLHDEMTRPDCVPYVRWDAPRKADGLLDGLSIWLASPTGFEPVF